MDLLNKVERFCAQRRLLLAGDAVLIACSGGPDSLALADLLLRMRESWRLRLTVLHVEHGIRGEASEADARFVREFCEARGLPFLLRRADVPKLAREEGLSLEDAARRARYAFLREAAAALGGAKIATGHHSGDQAETVLLHLLRGAGGAGLGGMRPARRGVIRPLLAATKGEILAYCGARELAAREDETNAQLAYARNRVRLSLLPQLAAFNPAVGEALCRTAELVGAEHDFVSECARAALAHCAADGGVLRIADETLAAQHVAVRREMIRQAIVQLCGHARELTFFHIEKVLALAAAQRTGKWLSLPGGIGARRAYDALELFKGKPAPPRRLELCLPLCVPGITSAPGTGLAVQAAFVSAGARESGRNAALFDADALALPLFVRTRRPGDRFRPSGAQYTKKLKDFLIDLKVAQEARERILLVCDQEEILWVAGYRCARKGRPGKETRRLLQLLLLAENGKGKV